MLFESVSVGTSKLGATSNVSAPVEALIVNLPASTPPIMEYVKLSRSPSVAATVVTTVEFSATGTVAVTPPVITGTAASATLVMVTEIVSTATAAPSVTDT